MGTFHANGGGASADPYNRVLLCPDFQSRFPNLSELFGGLFDEEGRVWKIYPCTMTIFFEASRMKYCVHPRHGCRVAFGSGQDGLGGFAELEQSLELGHFEWKNKGVQKRS